MTVEHIVSICVGVVVAFFLRRILWSRFRGRRDDR